MKKNWNVLIIIVITSFIYAPLLFIGRLSEDFGLHAAINNVTDVFSMPFGWPMRYMGNLSIMLDNLLFGKNLIGFHLSSILIQTINIVCVILLFKELIEDKVTAYLGASVYAFHFANVGSVAWLSDRWTLLSATFVLFTFLFYLKYNKSENISSLFLSFIFYAFALLTKESGLIVFLIIIAFSLIYKMEFVKANKLLFINLHILPYLIITLLYIFMRFICFPVGGYPVIFTKLVIGPPFYFIYSFLPFDIFEFLGMFNIDPNGIRSLFSENILLRIMFGLFAIVIISIMSFWLIQKKKKLNREELFGLIWFAFSILPFAAWFDLRWLNPATVGVSLFYVGLLNRTKIQLSSSFINIFKKSKNVIILISLIMSLLIISTSYRVKSWVEADKMVKSILTDIKMLYPKIRSNSLVFFINTPDSYKNAYVFRYGLETAIQEIYSDSTIKVNNNPLVSEGNKLLDYNESLQYIIGDSVNIRDAKNNGGDIILLRYNYIRNRTEIFNPNKQIDQIK